MKKFLDEQETASQPPERQGEQPPGSTTAVTDSEEDPGDSLFGETIERETEAEEEETEEVEWDGSQAELVADEGAAEYEEQNTGIKLKYALKSKEIFYVLLKTQYTSARMISSALAVVLCAAMAAVFYSQMLTTRNDSLGMLSGVCVVLIILIAALPSVNIKLQANRLANGKQIRMKIYPDHIQMGKDDDQWEIPLDGTGERMVFRNLIILYIGEKNMVILPMRCVDPNLLPEVEAMIFAGTQPKQK